MLEYDVELKKRRLWTAISKRPAATNRLVTTVDFKNETLRVRAALEVMARLHKLKHVKGLHWHELLAVAAPGFARPAPLSLGILLRPATQFEMPRVQRLVSWLNLALLRQLDISLLPEHPGIIDSVLESVITLLWTVLVQLHTLSIVSSSLECAPPERISSLVKVVGRFDHLEILNISTYFSDRGRVLSAFLSSLPKLRRLITTGPLVELETQPLWQLVELRSIGLACVCASTTSLPRHKLGQLLDIFLADPNRLPALRTIVLRSSPYGPLTRDVRSDGHLSFVRRDHRRLADVGALMPELRAAGLTLVDELGNVWRGSGTTSSRSSTDDMPWPCDSLLQPVESPTI